MAHHKINIICKTHSPCAKQPQMVTKKMMMLPQSSDVVFDVDRDIFVTPPNSEFRNLIRKMLVAL